MPTCRACGAKINRKNAYKNRKRGRGYILICKECRKKQIISARSRRKHENPTYLLKAINRAKPILFPSADDKRRFVTLRRLQSIGVRPKVGHSSRVGQRVEHIVEERDKDTNEIRRHYEETRCSECGGIIRYDDRGFKVCVSCGLLAELFTLSNELDPEPQARDLRSNEYYSYARQDISSEEESA